MTLQELFASPETWIRGEVARNSAGGPANCESEDAVCWCLLGAIYRCYGREDRSSEDIRRVTEQIQQWFKDNDINTPGITHYNDKVAVGFSDIKRLVTALNI